MCTQISEQEIAHSAAKGIDQVTEDPKMLQVANLEMCQRSFAIGRQDNKAYT